MTRGNIKYRDNMTQAEIDTFMAEINDLDAAYTAAAKNDAAQQGTYPDEWEDESEYWRRAGLDSRGRP